MLFSTLARGPLSASFANFLFFVLMDRMSLCEPAHSNQFWLADMNWVELPTQANLETWRYTKNGEVEENSCDGKSFPPSGGQANHDSRRKLNVCICLYMYFVFSRQVHSETFGFKEYTYMYSRIWSRWMKRYETVIFLFILRIFGSYLL